MVKVVDFGLVKDIEKRDKADLSGVHSIMGSPLYLSPESIRKPEKVDARSDLYSVGAVGYYLLTGQPVFDGESFVEICGHHLHSQPEPPSTRLKAPVPADLERLILQCLEKESSKRPANDSELRDALAECADAGDWSQESATRWWKERAPAIKSAARTEDARARGDAATQTVETLVSPDG